MSMIEVRAAVEDLSLNDELIQSPGFCRRTAVKVLEVIGKSDISEPHVSSNCVVYPEASIVENTHYAVVAYDEKETIIFNLNPANGFPIYIGSIDQAPGRLSEMKYTEEVI